MYLTQDFSLEYKKNFENSVIGKQTQTKNWQKVWTLHQRYTDDKQVREKMFKIISHRKMKGKTTRRYNTSVGKVVNQLELSYTADGNVKWHNHYGKVWQFPKKINIYLPYDPAILLLDIYPKK